MVIFEVAVNATRGGRNPRLASVTSNLADALGVEVPMPRECKLNCVNGI